MSRNVFEFFKADISFFNTGFKDAALESEFRFSAFNFTKRLIFFVFCFKIAISSFYLLDLFYLTEDFKLEENATFIVVFFCFYALEMVFMAMGCWVKQDKAWNRLLFAFICAAFLGSFCFVSILFNSPVNDPKKVSFIVANLVYLQFLTYITYGFSYFRAIFLLVYTLTVQISFMLPLIPTKEFFSRMLVFQLYAIGVGAYFMRINFHSRYLFLRSINNEYSKDYVTQLLNKMENGFMIFKNSKLHFKNEQIDDRFPELIDLVSWSEKLNQSEVDEFFETTFVKLETGDSEIHSNKSKEVSQKDLNRLTKVMTKRIINNLDSSLNSVESEQKLIEFRKVGVFTDHNASKYFEIFVSSHKVLQDEFLELIVVDVTDALEASSSKKDSEWKSKLVSKISHEFITPLVSSQQTMDKIKSLIKSSCVDDGARDEISAYCDKIYRLADYLVLLTKEVSEFIQINDDKVRNLVESDFCLLKLSRACAEIATNFTESKEDTQKTLSFKHSSGDSKLNAVLVRTAEYEFKNLLLNLYIIVVKIANRDSVEVNIEPDTSEPSQDTECHVCISFHSNFNVEDIKGESAKRDYSVAQGVDITYLICEKIAEDLSIELDFTEFGNKKVVMFKVPFVKAELESHLSESRLSGSRGTEQCNQATYLDEEMKNVFLEDGSSSVISDNQGPNQSQLEMNNVMFFRFETFQPKKIVPQPIMKVSTVKARHRKNSSCKQLESHRLIPKKPSPIGNSSVNFVRTLSRVPGATVKQTRSNLSIKVIEPIKKVLVVEDYSPMRHIASKIVKKLMGTAIEVVECKDGIECLWEIYTNELEERKEIMFILTDEFMPFMNGSKATQVIRGWESSKKIKNIPVISCTAFLDKANFESISEGGADIILSKPLEVPHVKTALENLHIL